MPLASRNLEIFKVYKCFLLSCRKILNDLSGVELDLRHKDSGDSGGDSSEDSNTSESTMTGSQAGMPSSTLGGPATDAINYAACK